MLRRILVYTVRYELKTAEGIEVWPVESLLRALESYFSHRLETKALLSAAESVFEEWNDPRDSDCHRL
jgi:hypothetical protein